MPESSDPLRVRFHQFGAPADVLQVEPLELPPLAEGMVRVRMLAAPINPADLNFIEGVYGVKPELPATPGIEGCGEIIESREPEWEPGTRVILLGRPGAWAGLLDARAADLLQVPAGIDPVQAAMLAVNPLTARRMLLDFGTLRAGDWVVQNAANSNVGRCVIQLARERGLNTINLVRRAGLHDELRDLGGTVVVPDGDGMVEEALEATGGARPRLALNAVGGRSALRQMDLLEDRGIHVTYGAMSREILKVPNKFLIFKELTLTGFWVTKWLGEAGREAVLEDYRELGDLVERGVLRQAVDRTYPLEEVRAACLRAQQEGRDGKVVLTMA